MLIIQLSAIKDLLRQFFLLKISLCIKPCFIQKQPPKVVYKQKCSLKFWYRCFAVNFDNFLRNLFLQNTSGRLLPLICSFSKMNINFKLVAIVCCFFWLSEASLLTTVSAPVTISQRLLPVK